jgi:hypothetical protein
MTNFYQQPGLSLPGLKSESGVRYAQASSRMGATFYPQKDDLFSTRQTGAIELDWRPKTTKGTVVALNFQKNMGAPSGAWSLSIKDTPPYTLDVDRGDILPGDWADLYIIRNGIRFPLCRGMIDSVRESTKSVGGATVRVWGITGRDHGMILEYPITYTSLWVRTMEELVAGLMTQRVQDIGGNPSKMFSLLLKAALARGTKASQFILPPALQERPKQPLIVDGQRRLRRERGFLDLLEVANTSPTRGAYYNEQKLWNNPGQSLAETINTWCNPLMNELFYDLAYPENFPTQGEVKSKVRATIRERPFVLTSSALEFTDSGFPGKKIGSGSSSPWFSLPVWTLPSWVLMGRDLGRNNHSRFNLVELLADVGFLTQNEQAAASPPRWYYDSIKYHGLKPFQQSTVFVNEGGTGQAGWAARRRDWQQVLVDWHCMNPYFRDGSITVKLPLPEIRVGQRLRIDPGIKDKRETFYVEGVALNGVVSGGKPSWQTSFTVTRGYKGDDRKLLTDTKKMSGKYKARF